MLSHAATHASIEKAPPERAAGRLVSRITDYACPPRPHRFLSLTHTHLSFLSHLVRTMRIPTPILEIKKLDPERAETIANTESVQGYRPMHAWRRGFGFR